MSRNELRTQSGNKLWLDDWQGQEGVELSTGHSGRSQLNLGFIPDGELNQRGAGAELRTSGHLAGRGGAGVLLTAYDQPGGNGKVLDTTQTRAQLDEHARLADTLAQSADASNASPADVGAQRAISADLDEVKKPGVLVTGPGPVGIASGDGVQIAADGSIIATSKKGVHFSTLKQFTAAVGSVVSLFAQKGMKLIASAGDMVIQAQRGAAQFAAQEDVTVESVNGVLHVKSPKEIVLGVGGSYIHIRPDGIEIGTRGGVQFRTSRVSKVGPAQMDLGGQAFAPVFVPFTTGCEVWRTTSKFTEEIGPAQRENVANTGAVAAAPASDDDVVFKTISAGKNDSPSFFGRIFDLLDNSQIKINDKENAPKSVNGAFPQEYLKPVELQEAAPCNWQMNNFVRDASFVMEIKRYFEYDISGSLPEKAEDRVWCSFNGGGTSCRFIYDAGSKTLTAKVVVVLKPKHLIKLDPGTKAPMRNKDGGYIFAAYHTSGNGANSRKTYDEHNLRVIERDVKDVDASAYKEEIESTLNRGNYKLILGGCRKGEACGCRVSVKFSVDILVASEADAVNIIANSKINIFPEADRADAANWGEVNYGIDDKKKRVRIVDQVKAHETGHLFNLPDEYYKAGGSVFGAYVKSDGTLNFELGEKNEAEKIDEIWQISSPENLMGYGALKSDADTRPYHLEYIRRWFSAYTGKEWRIGYASRKKVATSAAR